MENVNYNSLFASDIEANGLLDSVDKVWCIVSQDINTGEFYIFHDYPEFDNQIVIDPEDNKEYKIPERKGSLIDGARFWYKIGLNRGKIVCHNALSYDKPLLEKFYPKCIIPVETWHDTLIQSKIQWYDRPCPKGARGTHGLQAYGIRLGVEKPEINDWSFMDIMKLHRCIEDVKIQALTYKYLEKERVMVKEKLGIDFSEAFENETQYRINATKQEYNGAMVDVPFMHKCVVELDTIIEELRAEIEPQLPKQVKPKSTKVTKSDLGMSLGLNLKDSHSIKDGIAVVDKPYYKPTTSIFKTEIRKGYQGFYKDSYKTEAFVKLKECRDFIKEHYPETNLKDWTIEKKEDSFKILTKTVCDYFEIESTSDIVVGPFTKVEFNDTTLTQGEVVKSFLISQGWKNAPEWTLKKDKEGQFIRVQQDTEVRWPEKPLFGDPNNQLVRIVKRGQPLVVAPKLTEECYEELPDGLGKKIADYNTYQHRRRFLLNDKDDEKGLLNLVRPDGRITCGINNSSTSTLRSSHSNWVNAPGAGALYGEQIRSCIIAPEDRVLVGADMKSAQLSIAAYYANNYDYYLAVADGKEIKTDEFGNELIHPVSGKPWYLGESGHCVNARAFTLVSDEEWKRAVETQDQELIHHIALLRKKSKGGSFACVPKDNTQVLTREGWQWYDQLKVGAEVLTYNTDTGLQEWKPIQHMVEFDDKEVISMGNSHWKVESTEDHRWFGFRRTGRGNTKREVSGFLETKGIKSEFKLLNSAKLSEHSFNKDSILSPNEAAILSWLLSDGSWNWKPYSEKTSSVFGTKRGVKAVIHQSEHKYCEHLDLLLKGEDAYTDFYTKEYKTSCGKERVIRVYNIKPSYMRSLFLKANLPQKDKHDIDYTKLILNLGEKSLEAFVHNFWLADGYEHNKGGMRITQNEGSILDAVELALTLLGKNFSKSLKKTNYPTDKKCFDLCIRKKDYTGSTKFTKKSVGVRETFCITTENSTFVIKQNGVVTITGNCIFGASGKKVAQTLGIPEAVGEAKKQAFLSNIGLDEVINILQMMVNKNSRCDGGYIELPFGYYAWCKAPHKIFNYLDQGTEAACQKWAVNYFEEKATRLDLDYKKILDYHDEFAVESHKDCAEEVGKVMVEAYHEASIACWEWHKKHSKWFTGDSLPNFMFDLAAGFKVGKSYWDIH